jgi:hypothetical protein
MGADRRPNIIEFSGKIHALPAVYDRRTDAYHPPYISVGGCFHHIVDFLR